MKHYYFSCFFLASALVASAESGRLTATTENVQAVDGETYTWNETTATWQASSGYTLDASGSLNGNTVSNTNSSGMGIYADSKGTVLANDLTLEAGSYGVYSTNEGLVNIDGGSVTSGGASMFAITTGKIYGTGLTILSTGSAEGAVQAKWGGTLELSDSTVTCDTTMGIFINNAGSAMLKNVVVNSVTSGVRASEGTLANVKTITMEDITITTTGGDGYGIQGAQGAVITAKNVNVTTGGSSARGIYSADGSTITLDGTNVVKTTGSGGFGLLARYTNLGQDTNIILKEGATLKVTTTASSTHAVFAEPNDTNDTKAERSITFNGAIDVSTEGSNAHGLYALGNGSSVTANAGGAVHTEKSGSFAINAGGGGVVTGNNLDISTDTASAIKLAGTASNSKILYSFSGNSQVKLTDSTIASANNGVELASSSGTNNVTYTQTRGSLTAANHAFLVNGGNTSNTSGIIVSDTTVSAGTGKDVLQVSSGTNATFTASNTALTGNISVTNNDASASLSLTQGTRLTGSSSKGSTTGTINLSLEDSRWTLTGGNSSLTSLSALSGSTIDFHITDSGDFTNILAATAMLEDNTILNVTLGSGYTGVANDAFQLINSASLDAGTVKFNLGALASGLYWDTSTFTTDGTIRILNIPEPASSGLLLLAFAGLSLRRNKRKSN